MRNSLISMVANLLFWWTKQIFFLVIELEPLLLSWLQPRKSNCVPTEFDVSISAYVRVLIIFFMIFKVMCSFFFISLLILNALYDEMLLTQKMLNKVSFLIYIALHLSFEGYIKEMHCITLIQVRPFQKKKRLKENIYTTALYIPVNAHWVS